MREIQLRDAKASLSAVVDDAVRGEPAIITRHRALPAPWRIGRAVRAMRRVSATSSLPRPRKPTA
jgi:antitoxin (DNA-binding transcriptional repressor) of toxin-antitoxin stability system